MHAPCHAPHAGPQIHVPDYSKAAVAKENSQTSPGNERPFEGLIYYGYLAVGTRVRIAQHLVDGSSECPLQHCILRRAASSFHL